MDSRLEGKIRDLEAQHEKLVPIVERAERLRGEEKSLYSILYLKTDGKTGAIKEAQVYASPEWRAFSKALHHAKEDLINEQRLYDLRLKAYDAEHVTYKVEESAIRRQL